MKKRTTLVRTVLACSTVIVLLTTTSCKKEEEKEVMKSFDMAAAQKSIDSLTVVFTEAFNKGDASGVANCYTADAKFMPPNTTSKDGMPAIQTEIENYFKSGVAKLEIKSTGLWGNENLLVEESNWTISDKDGNHLDHGKSIVAYKKDKGQWKLFRDCYNSDMPCMPPPPAATPTASKK
ncbi:YybH family protein [Flavobacterium sp.]|uniref:YybH family protein n=1 Tax=Flavobacterium sp. TaxID=239 RepID=UPI002FD9FD91